MSNYDELLGVLKSLLTERFAPKPRYVRGILGDGLGNVVVPGRPDKSYVRFNRASTTYFEIFNRTVNPVHDWPVLIGELPWQPGLTQVVDTDWGAFEQSGWGDSLGSTSPHAPTHEWPDGSPGSDVVNIHTRALVPGRAWLSSSTPTTIYANSLEHGTTGTLWAGSPGVNLSPIIGATATGTMRYAGLYLDTGTNTLGVVTGSTTVLTSAFDPPRVSFPASNAIPIARVRVYGGQTALSEGDIKDARRLFTAGGTTTEPASGWPYSAVLTVDPTDTDADHSTIGAAITAASAGQVVEAGAANWNAAINVSKAVTLRGVDRDRVVLQQLLTLSAAGTVESLKVAFTGTNALFATTGATAATTIRNVTIAMTGSSTSSAAVNAGESCTFENCIISNAGGSSVSNYGLYASYTGATVTVKGGEISAAGTGAVALFVDTGTTVKLYGPKIVGTISNSGTISTDSYWYDGNGDLHLAADEAGFKQRLVNTSYTDIDDHFDTDSFSGYSWAAYAGFATPANISVTRFPSVLDLWHSATTRSFAYIAYSDGGVDLDKITGRVTCGTSARAGVRIDDGSLNNYVELYMVLNSGVIDIAGRYAIGGVVTGPTTVAAGLPVAYYTLELRYVPSTKIVTANYTHDGPTTTLLAVMTITAFSPTRVGIYHENTAASPANNHNSMIDWFRFGI